MSPDLCSSVGDSTALLVSEEQTSASSVRALRLARLPVADAASTVGIASVKALIKTTSGMAKMSTRLILQLGLSTCWRLLLAVNLELVGGGWIYEE